MIRPESFHAVQTTADTVHWIRNERSRPFTTIKTSAQLLKIATGVTLIVISAALGDSAMADPDADLSRAVAGEIAQTDRISTGAQEVLRLAESGVDEDVILAYIHNAQTPFDLHVEDIIYLNDLGVSAEAVMAMLRRDAALREATVQPAITSTDQFVYEQKLYSPANEPSTNAPSPNYVTNAPPQIVYFYDSLAPYGTWIELENYGWGWQPRIVVIDHAWRPYWHGGRWIYTDLGWYWHSDYSWGWAPFHYGRWHRHHRHGWIWFPDLVWGPAWVSWRLGDVHCGWAPLPPGAVFIIGEGWRFHNTQVGINFDFHLGIDLYTFVEVRHLLEHRPHLHGVRAARLKEAHDRTTVVNNYVGTINNRIVNRGLNAGKITAVTRHEIRPVTIAEIPSTRPGMIKRERVVMSGTETVIQRPVLAPPARPTMPIAQKADDRSPIVPAKPRRPSTLIPSRSPALTPAPINVPATVTRPTAPRTIPSTPATQPAQIDRGSPPQPVIPSTPQPARVRPTPPQSLPDRRTLPARSTAPGRVVVPSRSTSVPPDKFESPRGRDQRLSNGSRMQRSNPPPPPAQPASKRPAPRKTADDSRQ